MPGRSFEQRYEPGGRASAASRSDGRLRGTCSTAAGRSVPLEIVCASRPAWRAPLHVVFAGRWPSAPAGLARPRAGLADRDDAARVRRPRLARSITERHASSGEVAGCVCIALILPSYTARTGHKRLRLAREDCMDIAEALAFRSRTSLGPALVGRPPPMICVDGDVSYQTSSADHKQIHSRA